MIKKIFYCFLILILFGCQWSQAQEFSLYLIGDTGKDTIPSETLYLLEFESKSNENSGIIFLGDNVYPRGIPQNAQENSHQARILINQLNLFDNYKGHLFIIPGNHDWANGKRKGKNNAEAQEQVIANWRQKHNNIKNDVIFYPSKASPGPETILINQNIRLIFLNSQWFLQPSKRKRKNSEAKAVFTQLDSLIIAAKKNKEHVILLAHHPIYSNGKHASSKEPFRALFQYTPLRLLGYLGINRLFRQDIRDHVYKKYAKNIKTLMEKHEQIIYVSGHEHNIQHFIKSNNHFIVSGAGSKVERITHYFNQARLMEDQQKGFVRLIFDVNGSVYLAVHGSNSRGEFARYKLIDGQIKSNTDSIPDSTKSF